LKEKRLCELITIMEKNPSTGPNPFSTYKIIVDLLERKSNKKYKLDQGKTAISRV